MRLLPCHRYYFALCYFCSTEAHLKQPPLLQATLLEGKWLYSLLGGDSLSWLFRPNEALIYV
jgi:hypothetical protein